LEDPHQNEKIRQLNCRFEQLRGLERYPQWCVGILIGDRVGKASQQSFSDIREITEMAAEARRQDAGGAVTKS